VRARARARACVSNKAVEFKKLYFILYFTVLILYFIFSKI